MNSDQPVRATKTLFTVLIAIVIITSITCLVTVARADTGTAPIDPQATTDAGTPTDSTNNQGTLDAPIAGTPFTVTTNDTGVSGVEHLTTCQIFSWQESVINYGTCTRQVPVTTCADPPTNTSCTTSLTTEAYQCENGTILVPRQRTVCNADEYRINGNTLLNTTGYNCTATNNGKIYLTCDSEYDGNGDGTCTSGESCVQFGIVGNYITAQERNSQDTWLDHDATFTITPAVEVQS